MSSQVLFIVLTIYGVFIALTESMPLFAIAKQQQLEQISPKHFKIFKDFMFPSEMTESTGTRMRHVDTEKSRDFIFPTEFKESTVSRVIIFDNAKTRDYQSSTRATESTTSKAVPDKKIEIVDFIFPSDLTTSRLTNYNNDKAIELDKRISLACTLTLCWGKK